jgi:hypothetical protein
MSPDHTSGRPRFVVLLLAVLLVGMATPSVAGSVVARARNADKVDHLSAVKSTASLKKRRGRLVATDKKTGLLPAAIIPPGSDSGTVDGLDSSAFVQGSTVQHRVANCTGLGFQPEDSSTSVSQSDGMRSSGTPNDLACAIDLPANAVIRSVTFTLYDNDGAHDAACELFHLTVISGVAEIKYLSTAATTGISTVYQTITDSTITDPLVTPDRSYFLSCRLGVNGLILLVSGSVAYDITAAGTTPR